MVLADIIFFSMSLFACHVQLNHFFVCYRGHSLMDQCLTLAMTEVTPLNLILEAAK
jgi:hypothetical protein